MRMLFTLGAPFVAVALFGGSAAYTVAGPIETSFSDGYTDQAFGQLRVGQTRDEVASLAGTPRWFGHSLSACGLKAPAWNYTTSATGARRFEQRTVVFGSDGRVKQIISRVSWVDDEEAQYLFGPAVSGC